jgi:hypothetical protein
LSAIIIKENLKLLQINYSARKMDVMFNFPARSYCTCNRTYGKIMYIQFRLLFFLYIKQHSWTATNKQMGQAWSGVTGLLGT